jgi:glycosyltransferase involved in cell wall biosynthesis
MKPLVSILIPAYNAEQWISESIESAVDQTWDHKEIIIVDDGSTDRTLAIAQRYASPNVTVTTQSNQGAAATRNKALSLSKGDYIQWLDADDILASDKVVRQMEALAECPGRRTLLSSSWARFMFRRDRARFTPTALWADLAPTEWLLRKMEQNLYMQTGTWLVSRELTEAAGPWNTQLLGDDDGEYFCRVLLASDGVKFVPDSKVFYRVSGATALSYIGRSSRKIEAQFASMQMHIDYLRSLEDSQRVRTACIRYLQNWLVALYPERPDIVTRAERLAAELGGSLEAPRFSWKYAWIGAVAGPDLAKRAQVFSRHARWSVSRSLDKALFHAERISRGVQ